MSEEIKNSRRKLINLELFELAKPGFANGISLQLKSILDKGEHRSLNEKEKSKIIDRASVAYGKFLDELGCDWRNDPNSMETPRRVAKKYVNDLWIGRYNIPSDIASFPSDGYEGVVLEKDIPLTSMCSHHHESILGKVHIAYIPGTNGEVVGLSKLNRIVEHFGRRGAIQEQLTKAIHNAVGQICIGNIGVFVMIEATHNCVQCRGVKHQGASMVTTEVSGVFADHTKTAKQEVLTYISKR
jgi:GTP cyclohydrolase I